MNNIIGLTGLKGCGKSTVASILKKIGYAEYSFAQPMKEALAVMTGLDYQVFDSQETKEVPLAQFGGVTPRHMMQTLGTEWGRQMIQSDFWLMIAEQRLFNLKKVVVSDIRFENEASLIRKMGGVVIHIERNIVKNETSNHLSEKGIAFEEVDLLIVNDGDLTSLAKKTEATLRLI
jgi:energy-coupling factor transporter ATP-binding protein EcfA2